ncbi:MAG: AI-2E family transporter [Candidatus Binatia bacterium]|nr:MAG: AI-2E family transporter [Candidatus Binatia bacterium]
MSRQQVFAAFFVLLFATLLYHVYRLFAPFLTPLFWGALLALVFYPLQARLARLLRNRDGLAAFLLTAGVFSLVIVPAIFLATVLVAETAAAYRHLERALTQGDWRTWTEEFRRLAEKWLGERPALEAWVRSIDLPAVLLRLTNAVSSFVVSRVTDALRNAVGFVTDFVLTAFVLFFFLRDGPRFVGSLRSALPMETGHKDVVLRRFADTLFAVVQGVLLTALVQGLVAGFGFWLVGLSFSVLLGCLTAFLALFPFGGSLVWMGAVVFLLLSGAWARALVLLAWGALLVSSVDNVVRPLVIGGRTQMSTLFLFFGILGGLQAYGFLGMFLGPVLLATLVAVVQIFREEYGLREESG